MDLAEETLAMAQQQTGDMVQLILARSLMADLLLFRGKFAAALEHYERVSALSDSLREPVLQPGMDAEQGVTTRSLAAWSLWQLGWPDRALVRAQDAVTRARAVGHPYTVAFALFCETVIHWMRRDAVSQKKVADETIAISEMQGFPLFLGLARAFEGATRITVGTTPAAAQVMEGLALASSTGTQAGAPVLLTLLAEAQVAANHCAEALATIETGLTVAAQTRQHGWDAELHRLRGELHSGDQAEVESCFRRALEIARRQESRSLELRAATSLARLLRVQGKHVEARAVLAPVYGWFTEGFDTKDLKDAQAVLEELR
jgi:hypothetical protein